MEFNPLENEKNYEVMRDLGKGVSGKVSMIKIKATNQILALKVIPLNGFHNLEERTEKLEEAKNEFRILSKKLPNVVPAFDSYYDEEKEKFCFTMEYFPYNLEQYCEENFISKSRKPNIVEYFRLFQNILNGNRIF